MSDCIKDLTILQIHTPYLLLIISKKCFFNCRLDDESVHPFWLFKASLTGKPRVLQVWIA